MKQNRWLTTGILGTGFTAICCFTPALATPLGVLGLSAWLIWLDYILLPLLVLFFGIMIFGWWSNRRATD